jgi:alpha-tubulin suppressor-like RCC1 family protein
MYGQVGNLGTLHAIARTPVPIGRDKLDGDSAIAVQCGEYHTMIATEIAAYTFGLNAQGQLGRPGFDEWKPAKPILWSTTRFVPHPNYPSFVLGQGSCPRNN